jgi:hypothetical protein
MATRKRWWAAVWSGLVVDPEAKHWQRMKHAVWLYLYLVLHANRQTGFLVRKVRTIAADMGVKRGTVHRWLKVLRMHGYIVTVNTGRYLAGKVAAGVAMLRRCGATSHRCGRGGQT